MGGERHCESKVSCPKTQHNVPGQDSNPDRSLTNHEATAPPTSFDWFIGFSMFFGIGQNIFGFVLRHLIKNRSNQRRF